MTIAQPISGVSPTNASAPAISSSSVIQFANGLTIRPSESRWSSSIRLGP